jgi:hypothetical protein
MGDREEKKMVWKKLRVEKKQHQKPLKPNKEERKCK